TLAASEAAVNCSRAIASAHWTAALVLIGLPARSDGERGRKASKFNRQSLTGTRRSEAERYNVRPRKFIFHKDHVVPQYPPEVQQMYDVLLSLDGVSSAELGLIDLTDVDIESLSLPQMFGDLPQVALRRTSGGRQYEKLVTMTL